MLKKLFIGVDVGGTKIAAAVVTGQGKILSQEKSSTPLRAKPKEISNILRSLCKEVLAEANVTKKDLAAIGIGIPGLVDATGKKILRTPNIRLAGFPLIKELKKTFPVPMVLGNDVNVGLLGEKWLGAGRSYRHIVGIFPGTGVGGAILIDGKLFTGTTGLAAEIGHMTVDLNGPSCHCGNRGCLEALVSRWAIERDIRQAVHRGEKTIIVKLTDGQLKTIKSKTLKKALKSHDRVTTRILQRVSKTLGQACVSIDHLLNPQLIILGGGVIEACGDFILPIVTRFMRDDPFFARLGSCRVVTAKLGDDAVLLGAVALAQTLLKPLSAQKKRLAGKRR